MGLHFWFEYLIIIPLYEIIMRILLDDNLVTGR